MMRNLLRYSALAALVSVSACDLDVRNPNSPETARVLASPADLENLLASYYKRWHDGLYRTTGSVWGMANVQSFENYSSLANDGQNARAPIPRPPNDNSIGNPVQSNQSRTFFVHSEVGRVATNIMKTLNAPGYSLGGTAAKDLRAKAFGEFLRGISLGYLALLYDSAAVVHEGLAGEEGGVCCLAAIHRFREPERRGDGSYGWFPDHVDSDIDQHVGGELRPPGFQLSGPIPRQRCADTRRACGRQRRWARGLERGHR
jgi:hypothetical protein